MMQRMLRTPGVAFTAICDIYEPRFAEARLIAGDDTPVFADYRRMLDTVSDLDAVLIASPISVHAEHMTGALAAGLHVYGEKSMGFTMDDCNRIVDAVDTSGKIFQVGHQYRYAPWTTEAINRIRDGEIGDVTHIYAYWHRNNNWRRSVPSSDLERLLNWRLYRDTSGGLLAELGSHHIDMANWIFGAYPSSVVGNGAITFYDDGREIPDNIQTIFTYPEGQTLFFSSILGNHKKGYQINVYGTGGSAEITFQDATFFYEPARSNSAVPDEMVDEGMYTSATLATQGDMPYRGPGQPVTIAPDTLTDADLLACNDFFESLRANTRPMADERVGWRSAIAVAVGNEAIYSGERITIADHVRPLPARADNAR